MENKKVPVLIEESLLRDPESELQLLGREKGRANTMSGTKKKERKKQS